MFSKFIKRNIKTVEIISSKIFPAGGGWQSASICADKIGYLSNELPFFALVGCGEGLAVGLGHLAYNGIKNKITNVDMDTEKKNSLMFGTAAAFSGTVWQPIVNLYTEASNDIPLALIAPITGMVCGMAFMGGLSFSRCFYNISNIDNDIFKNDTQLSLSIAGAAGMFVATDASISNNFLVDYFGILENMTNNKQIITAGLSTSTGFIILQTLQNFKKRNYLD